MKTHRVLSLLVVAFTVILFASLASAASPLSVATFEVDVTPPLGSPLCDGLVPPVAEIVDPLTARGVVLLGGEKTIVLCAVDWVGIGNSGHDAWREALAAAAGTTPDQVCVHSLHQHDAPGCDFDAEMLLAMRGQPGQQFHVAFARDAITRVAEAVRQAVPQAQPVTHVGLGRAPVEKVASSRRILGDDGRVKYVRFSSCADPVGRALPEGVIDPDVRLISFFNQDQPLAVLSYYATHPQSFYGKGGVSAEFVGLARNQRQSESGVPHIHFCGAGGNVAAGKYNDGSPENRPVLAGRLAAGMKAAWEATQKTPVNAAAQLKVEAVTLPPNPNLDADQLTQLMDNDQASMVQRIQASRNYTFLKRMESGTQIPITCLHIGPARVLHMPGELFVEYQLAAQAMRPDDFVAMAAYGDYGAGYIGIEKAYDQGGYETGPVSRVSPTVERILNRAMESLLK